jgi:hypothetical protein
VRFTSNKINHSFSFILNYSPPSIDPPAPAPKIVTLRDTIFRPFLLFPSFTSQKPTEPSYFIRVSMKKFFKVFKRLFFLNNLKELKISKKSYDYLIFVEKTLKRKGLGKNESEKY